MHSNVGGAWRLSGPSHRHISTGSRFVITVWLCSFVLMGQTGIQNIAASSRGTRTGEDPSLTSSAWHGAWLRWADWNCDPLFTARNPPHQGGLQGPSATGDATGSFECVVDADYPLFAASLLLRGGTSTSQRKAMSAQRSADGSISIKKRSRSKKLPTRSREKVPLFHM